MKLRAIVEVDYKRDGLLRPDSGCPLTEKPHGEQHTEYAGRLLQIMPALKRIHFDWPLICIFDEICGRCLRFGLFGTVFSPTTNCGQVSPARPIRRTAFQQGKQCEPNRKLLQDRSAGFVYQGVAIRNSLHDAKP
jgi:hypothetical protein